MSTKSAASSPRRRRLVRVVVALVLALVALSLVLVIKTLLTPSQQLEPGSFTPLSVDEDAAVEHLRAALRVKTISPQDDDAFDGAPFLELHALLERSYPLVHAKLEREVIADHSLLYRWEGSDPDAKPLLLLAHMDVVPIAAPDDWSHDPWAADLDEEGIWGRGAMDDKGSLIAIFEAAEAMLAAGITPPRTIYLAFGHDEERQGLGAQAIAAHLAEQGVRVGLALDEGVGITLGVMPGVGPDTPVAMIGVSEKGDVTFELSVESEGGHSSTPPEHTAIGILAAAIARIEDHQLPTRLDGPFGETLEALGPEMQGPLRFVATNLWLLRPVVLRILTGDPSTASAVRTTTAVTVISGGVKRNVLPRTATAMVNHRINAGDTVASIEAHLREVIDDERVTLKTQPTPQEVSPISASEGPAYELVARSLREAYPELLVVPGLCVAATDVRHYAEVAEQSYRIAPYHMDKADIARFHGVDERLRRADFAAMIQFFGRMMQGSP